MAPVLLLRAMHVRIPLTRNNLLSFPSPFSSSSFPSNPLLPATPCRLLSPVCAYMFCPSLLLAGLPCAQACDPIRVGNRARDGERRFAISLNRVAARFANFTRLSAPVYLTTRNLALNRCQRRRAMLHPGVIGISPSLVHDYITRDSLVLYERYKFSQLKI